MVSYARDTTESYRHFGRLGLGAVFGSKRLKALLAWAAGAVERGLVPEKETMELRWGECGPYMDAFDRRGFPRSSPPLAPV